MINKIIRLRSTSGTKKTVMYLKGAKLIFDHYLAGKPVYHGGSDPRIAISKFGVPLIIPKSLHKLIANGDLRVIRVCSGLLSLFRILPLKGEEKLNTITSPFSGLSTILPGLKVRRIYEDLFQNLRGSHGKGLQCILPLRTAGPNYKISVLGATADAKALANSHLLEPFTILSKYFESGLHHLLSAENSFASDLQPSKELKLAKLSAKPEPAGKVRIFAIVDV